MKTYRQDQLITFTLKAITEHSNQIAALIGTKPTKRFATKTAAVKKALANQIAYTKELEKVNAEIDQLDPVEQPAPEAPEQPAPTTEPTVEQPEPEPKLPTVTIKEVRLIAKIAENEMTSLNGGEPSTVEETVGYAYSAMDTQSDGGVMASLIKKDLAWFDEVGKGEPDQCVDQCGLTELGLQVYKAYKANSPFNLTKGESAPEAPEAPEAPKVETVVKATTKTRKNRAGTKLTPQTILARTNKNAKSGTARAVVMDGFKGNHEATVQQVAEYFMDNYQEKSGLTTIDETYAKGYINGSIRKGFITIK